MPSHDAIFGYARQIISPNQLIKGFVIVAVITRRLVGSTDQVNPSCFCFMNIDGTTLILFFGPFHGLRRPNEGKRHPMKA